MATRLKIAMWTENKIHPGYWANPEISIINYYFKAFKMAISFDNQDKKNKMFVL